MSNFQTRTHWLSGASLPNLSRVLYANRKEIQAKYIPKILQIAITPMLVFPFHLAERVFYYRRIRRTNITRDPVFIIGHFRSGTTYMHNLICQDPQFGFPTTYQCFVPDTFLSGKNLLKAIHRTTLPEKRPMDNVKLDSDFPQEEEIAIAALSPYSFYQCYFFPKKIKSFFNDYFLLNSGISDQWERIYLFILRKMTYACNGKQMVLKNPVNTGRIEHILKLFPDAKFIYMHRKEEQVLKSTYKLFQKFLDLLSFQVMDEEELKENIRWMHCQILEQYEKQKQLIPRRNLVEIRYENFIQKPLEEITRVYRELNLTGFEEAKTCFERYIAMQASFVTDVYSRTVEQ